MARKKQKTYRKASIGHIASKPVRNRIAYSIQLAYHSFCNAVVARNSPDGEYDTLTEASWGDNAATNMWEAGELLKSNGWNEAQVQVIWDNLYRRTGA